MNGCDLLIVGTGPTGLVLALWRAKLGVRVHPGHAEKAGSDTAWVMSPDRKMHYRSPSF
jgi:flavin-dependent dehydrogenase